MDTLSKLELMRLPMMQHTNKHKRNKPREGDLVSDPLRAVDAAAPVSVRLTLKVSISISYSASDINRDSEPVPQRFLTPIMFPSAGSAAKRFLRTLSSIIQHGDSIDSTLTAEHRVQCYRPLA